MSRKNRLFLTAVLLAAFLAIFTIFAAASDIYPQQDGSYSVEKEGLAPEETYVALVASGLYEDGELPTVSKDSVLYFTVCSSDADGFLSFSYIPSSYRDSTVFLASGDLVKPVVVAHALAGDAKDVAEIEVRLSEDTILVLGEGNNHSITYTVSAYDSFGFPAPLPQDAVFALDKNDSGNIRINRDTDSIFLSGVTAAGTYTLSVTCGDTTGQASFTVSHDAKPERMGYLVDYEGTPDTDYSSYIMVAINSARENVLEPDELLFRTVTYDQYGGVIPGEYVFTYARRDNGALGNSVEFGRGTSASFVPTELPELETSDYYVITMTNTVDPSVSASVEVEVYSLSLYSGKEQSLFLAYREAEAYLDAIQRGAIIVTESGESVSSDKKWIKKTYADSLSASAERAKELLIRAETETIPENPLTEMLDELKNIVFRFAGALKSGAYSRILSLAFGEEERYVTLGTYDLYPATVTPPRPSEKLTYESDDVNVATVDADGKVYAAAIGKTLIHAYNPDRSVEASYTLTVYQPVTDILAEKDVLLVNVGTRIDCPFRFLPDGHTDIVSYQSDNTGVAIVDNDGNVSARGEGTAAITATTRSGKTKSVTVDAKTASVSLSTATVQPGGKAKILVSVADLRETADLTVTVAYNGSVFAYDSYTDRGLLGEGKTPAVKSETGYVTFTYDELDAAESVSGVLLEVYLAVNAQAQTGSYYATPAATVHDVRLYDVETAPVRANVTVTNTFFGDVDTSGAIDDDDRLLLERYLAGYPVTLSAENADVNADGYVSAGDLLRLAKFLAGFDVELGR